MNPALYQLSYAAAHGIYNYTMIGVKWANGKNRRRRGGVRGTLCGPAWSAAAKHVIVPAAILAQA